jgi:hypothetical protein
MNTSRREAIKKGLIFIGGSLFLPEITKAWSSQEIDNQSIVFGDYQSQLIAEISELIIPTTDTPGAKAAGVPLFIKKMVADCISSKDRERFFDSMAEFELQVKDDFGGKKFLDLEQKDQIEILKKSQSTYFFKTMKWLTISGYFTSEIGATQALRYEEIPGRYEGDVPYKKGEKAWQR